MGCLHNLNYLIADVSTTGVSISTREAEQTVHTSEAHRTSTSNQNTEAATNYEGTTEQDLLMTTETMLTSPNNPTREIRGTSTKKNNLPTYTPRIQMTTEKNIRKSPDIFKILFSIFIPILAIALCTVILILFMVYLRNRNIRLARDELITLQLASFETEI